MNTVPMGWFTILCGTLHLTLSFKVLSDQGVIERWEIVEREGVARKPPFSSIYWKIDMAWQVSRCSVLVEDVTDVWQIHLPRSSRELMFCGGS